MASKYKVVITDHRFQNVDIQREVLSKIGAELIEGQAKTEDDIIAIAKDAHGILNARSKITAKVIDALTSCKVMVRYGVGVDTIDFAAAFRASLRQDPDIILVGELRDAETMGIALRAAETGHLVLSTLHTTDAKETIGRFIDTFPPHQQQQVRIQLAANLRAVALANLARLLDLPIGTSIELIDPLDAASDQSGELEALAAEALDQRPER